MTFSLLWILASQNEGPPKSLKTDDFLNHKTETKHTYPITILGILDRRCLFHWLLEDISLPGLWEEGYFSIFIITKQLPMSGFCSKHPTKGAQNSSNPTEHWKKGPWLFRLYWGFYSPLLLEIPLKQPVYWKVISGSFSLQEVNIQLHPIPKQQGNDGVLTVTSHACVPEPCPVLLACS